MYLKNLSNKYDKYGVFMHVRMMYWRLGTNIETAAMDGTQRKVLVTEVGRSLGLSIDLEGVWGVRVRSHSLKTCSKV